ncbi:MAG: bifunctional folylpolyglutamate synthase/dihydrofolate synthase [Deltaproteobacteria bacterium]|nr:bifunctional folylpolyglutamate synthase/dihydrofolate synthase [Deltaproteobacteria bacterium]
MQKLDYATVLQLLFTRTNQGIKLGLETTQALLHALGNPERQMRHVVIAGTNGKGSTSNFIASALQSAGHCVGHYTSPHLLRFTERIRINSVEINHDDVVRLYMNIRRAESACPRPATFFEIITVMALLAFAEANVDITVMEIGLGGRFDAVNVVDKLLAVITPISLDHMQYLGNNLTAIANEKAGIIGRHTVVVTSQQKPEVLAVLKKTAATQNAHLVMATQAQKNTDKISINHAAGMLEFKHTPIAAYQRENLATACTAIRELVKLGVACPDAAIYRAVSDFQWPGRYQWIDGKPDILIDGAHNPAGIKALLSAIAEDSRIGNKPVHTVATILTDRPYEQMLLPILTRSTTLHLTTINNSRSRTYTELKKLAPKAFVYSNVNEAISQAKAHAIKNNGIVLICGSLFLVAETLALLQNQKRDPLING